MSTVTPYVNTPSRIVIKTSRETLVLCAAATAMTFALAHVVHPRPGPAADARAPATQDWTGHLSDAALPTPSKASAPERITSASLVMPKEQLALPKLDLRPLAKLRFCDDGVCAGRTETPVPSRRETAERAVQRVTAKYEEPEQQPGLLTRMNPLKQVSFKQVTEVPGLLKKPFVYAGDTVSGWFKRF